MKPSEQVRITKSNNEEIKPPKHMHITPTKIILLGFLIIILTGAVLLMLPVSSRSGQLTPFIKALFAATSATCVTGLVVVDTYTYWSMFGQAVILALIQVGGLGFITMAIMVAVFTRRRIGLKQRILMQEAISAPQPGGIVRLAKFAFFATMLIEGAGVLLLAFRLCPQMGFWRGVYFALFHSVSAFCNAGFDLMGYLEPGSSLVHFSGDILVNLVIMSLIVIGGLGFWVWADLKHQKLRVHKYTLQSKLVLTTTALLILAGAAAFLLIEWGGPVLAGNSFGERILIGFFQSVTPRTAGFNTVNLAALQSATQFILIVLMLIGGSPGSTAGGIKTTTAAVLFLFIRSVFQKQPSISCYHRRMDDKVLKNAVTILTFYLVLFSTAAILISCIDHLPMLSTLFESASAIGTVGLSLGITPQLSAPSLLILAFLMYFGRVGCLTLVYALAEDHTAVPSRMPLENIVVG